MALASAPRMLTGDVGFFVPEWGNAVIKMTFDVHEANLVSHAASGIVTVQLNSDYGSKNLSFAPTCMYFGEDNTSKPTLILVMKVTETTVTEAGTGLVGEYAKWLVRDGGTPGSKGDEITIKSYQLDPTWIEYWPAGSPPDCTTFESTPGYEYPIPVKEGNLTIH